jgi:hypothetical protein
MTVPLGPGLSDARVPCGSRMRIATRKLGADRVEVIVAGCRMVARTNRNVGWQAPIDLVSGKLSDVRPAKSAPRLGEPGGLCVFDDGPPREVRIWVQERLGCSLAELLLVHEVVHALLGKRVDHGRAWRRLYALCVAVVLDKNCREVDRHLRPTFEELGAYGRRPDPRTLDFAAEVQARSDRINSDMGRHQAAVRRIRNRLDNAGTRTRPRN